MRLLSFITSILLSLITIGQTEDPNTLIEQSISIIGSEISELKDFHSNHVFVDSMKAGKEVIRKYKYTNHIELFTLEENERITSITYWLYEEKTVQAFAEHLELNYKIIKKEALGFYFISEDKNYIITFFRSLTTGIYKLGVKPNFSD